MSDDMINFLQFRDESMTTSVNRGALDLLPAYGKRKTATFFFLEKK